MEKTIETKNYKFVIADSSHEDLNSKDDEKMIISRGIYGKKPKPTYIINSDYYNTPEALATGITKLLLSEEMVNAAEEQPTEEKIEERSNIISEELIEILGKLNKGKA